MKVLFAAVLFCIALLPTTAEVQDNPENNVVFMGSSSIARWTTLKQDFPDAHVFNWSAGGTGMSDAIELMPLVISYKPRIIVLYSGENDISAGKTPEAVYADFKVFVARVHATLPNTRIVYISMKPSPSRSHIMDKIVAANALIGNECAKDIRLRFVDVYHRMLTTDGRPNADLFVKDMLHMNEDGYAIWKQVVEPLLD